MQVEARKVITIDYTLTDTDGEILDSSETDGPLTYLHGFGNIIPGLEAALEGKSPGDNLQVTIAPAQAYGERDESLVQAVPRHRFPKGDIEVGMQFAAESAHGSRLRTVVAVDQQVITVDGNHPL
ncbi:MAG: peptidylprolyl isomerase, partial [Pseudomonadota bacterium]